MKTRVTLLKGGVEKVLFSVTERGSGDLLIVPRSARALEWGETGLTTKRNEHYSVHMSPDSPGNTVKYTIDLEGGGRIDNSDYRLPGPDGFVSIVTGRTVPNLHPDKYSLSSSRKGNVVRLFGADIDDMTMFYFIVATGANCPEIVGTGELAVRWMGFSHFKLAVLYGMFIVPSLPAADKVHLTSSFPRFDPLEEIVPLPMDVMRSLSIEGAFAEIAALLTILQQLTAQRQEAFIRSYGGSDDQIAMVHEHIKYVALPNTNPDRPFELRAI